MSKVKAPFQALNMAVLTVSDTRNEQTDTSGKALVDGLREAGHNLVDKKIVIDDVYKIRAHVCHWIASDDVQVVLVTGGTGFTGRDSTPEALLPVLDKQVIGFGELFRQISYEQIGTSTIQSRAFAGLANGTLVFGMPGSTNACKTAWYDVIKQQVDASHTPCNFVGQLKTTNVQTCGADDNSGCDTRG